MLAGVAGGLARYFDIHPAFFRVGFVVLALLGGSGILIYAAAALVMPGEGEADSVATRALRQRRDRPWPLIGLGLLAVAGAVAVSNMSFWPHGSSRPGSRASSSTRTAPSRRAPSWTSSPRESARSSS